MNVDTSQQNEALLIGSIVKRAKKEKVTRVTCGPCCTNDFGVENAYKGRRQNKSEAKGVLSYM